MPIILKYKPISPTILIPSSFLLFGLLNILMRVNTLIQIGQKKNKVLFQIHVNIKERDRLNELSLLNSLVGCDGTKDNKVIILSINVSL